jgi:hypothetical protein
MNEVIKSLLGVNCNVEQSWTDDQQKAIFEAAGQLVTDGDESVKSFFELSGPAIQHVGMVAEAMYETVLLTTSRIDPMLEMAAGLCNHSMRTLVISAFFAGIGFHSQMKSDLSITVKE